jgi:hypothetical protein
MPVSIYVPMYAHQFSRRNRRTKANLHFIRGNIQRNDRIRAYREFYNDTAKCLQASLINPRFQGVYGMFDLWHGMGCLSTVRQRCLLGDFGREAKMKAQNQLL